MDNHALHQVDSIVTATYDEDAIGAERGEQHAESETEAPVHVHHFQHDQSILALATTDAHIYAGTQGGEILVFSLQTYERMAELRAHSGSVLALSFSRDKRLLFSSATDRYVNASATYRLELLAKILIKAQVWELDSYKHLVSIYSAYDIGDIFCTAYSSTLETIYLGCQNTSIQWCNLKDYASKPPPNPDFHPSQRHDRFFDSPGPGGIRTPRRDTPEPQTTSVHNLEIDKSHVHQFAHYGYVYCMLLAPDIEALQREETLVTGGGDGVIRFWAFDSTLEGAIKELGHLDDGRDAGESVLTIALDGNFLYSGRVEGEINVWDLETKQLLRVMRPHEHDILSLSFGGGYVFAAAMDGSVTRFDYRYEWLGGWQAHHGMVLASVCATPDGRPTYITGGNDNTIALWDIRDADDTMFHTTPTAESHLLESLRQFISYRTVSSDVRCRADCRRAASWLRSVFKRYGAITELLGTEEGYNPVVFAKFRSTNRSNGPKKRILFYGHYDVVAAKSEHQRGWTSSPFEMQGRDGYLYGRGVSDNKGPIMAAVYAVAELVAQNALDCDIIFLVEGEEECGSRGFKQTIIKNKEMVGEVDWILLANSYWLDDEVPCLTYGLRGVIHATVQVHSDEPDLHSGVDGSSLLDEPVKDLMALLSQLSGRHGRVQVPHFYDDILPVTHREKLLYQDISRTLLERDSSLGTPETLTKSLLARWADATLTIHNFKTSGPQNATIIPRQAQASLSLRLVPNQSVEQIAQDLTSYLRASFAKLGSKNHITVTIGNQAEPWLGDHTNKLFQTLERAIMNVWTPQDARRRSSVSHPHKTSGQKDTARRPSLSWKSSPATSSTLAQKSNNQVVEKAGPAEPAHPLTEFSAGNTATSTHKTSRKPLYIREGGSIPAIRFLEKEFGAAAAHLPCGQASDNAHLDNERFRVLNLYNSKEIFKRVFAELPWA